MRHVLPLSSVTPIPPGTRTAIPGNPTKAMQVAQIVIGGPDPAGWVVHDLLIGGHSQLSCDLPGKLFSSRGVVATPRGVSTLFLRGLDVAAPDLPITLVVSYVGPNPEGARFFGVLVGNDPPPTLPRLEITSDRPIAASRAATIVATVPICAFGIERIEIHGDAEAWAIDDIRIDGKTQLAQPGELPGVMFAADAIDNFVSFDPCPTGRPMELDVRYIGADPAGAVFRAVYEGTIIHESMIADPGVLRADVTTADRVV